MRAVARAALTLVLAGSAAVALAQGARLQPGEMLYNGVDHQMKVLECRDAAYGSRECRTVAWEDGRPASNPAWWNEKDLIGGDVRVREHLGLPPRAAAAAATPQPARGAAPARRAPATTVAQRPAAGGRVPDGRYACQLWMGNSYVSLGAVRSVNGQLTPNPVAKAGGTITGVAPSAEGITISYTTARGYRESMDCKRA